MREERAEKDHGKYKFPFSDKLGLMLALAMVMLGIGVFKIVRYFSSDLISVEAVIKEVQTRNTGKHRKHDALVTYEYAGVTYSGIKLDYWRTGMNEGDTVEIKIDPDAPEQIVTVSGFLIMAMGAVLGIKAVRKRKETEMAD